MSKRSAEEVTGAPIHAATPLAPALVTSVITIMKAAYGAVPKAFWGLCHAGEAGLAGTSREFTIDTPDSFKFYCRHLTEPGRYRIVRLTTAGVFNRRITILDTVRKLSFGSKFDSQIVFPTSHTLEEIEFDEECAFSRPIVIPDGVRRVLFGRWFNRSATLPSSLRIVEFGEMFNCHVDISPEVTELYVGGSANREIALIDGIQVIRLGGCFRQNIVLPTGLQRATFMGTGGWYNYSIVLPDTLKYANIGRCVNIDPGYTLPPALEELVWHHDVPVNLPVTVKHLALGEDFCRSLDLHEGLETIVFLGKYWGDNYNRPPLNLPSGLKSIRLSRDSETRFALPDGCVRLY